MNSNAVAYLITSKPTLKQFVLASDRELFSRPVRVELVYTGVFDRLLFVRMPDQPERGLFAVAKGNLRAEWQLSRRQKKAVGA
jgi:hypothetical protein